MFIDKFGMFTSSFQSMRRKTTCNEVINIPNIVSMKKANGEKCQKKKTSRDYRRLHHSKFKGFGINVEPLSCPNEAVVASPAPAQKKSVGDLNPQIDASSLHLFRQILHHPASADP